MSGRPALRARIEAAAEFAGGSIHCLPRNSPGAVPGGTGSVHPSSSSSSSSKTTFSEVFYEFQKLLVAFVPLRGVLVHKDDALVSKTELDIANLANVIDQVLRLMHFSRCLVGKLLRRCSCSDQHGPGRLLPTGLRSSSQTARPRLFAVSTKSFQLSGLSSSSHRTVGRSSVINPGSRRMEWPSMKATMSSFREIKSSGCIWKPLLSQMLARRVRRGWVGNPGKCVKYAIVRVRSHDFFAGVRESSGAPNGRTN